jgi:ABC-2 type transport system permease protein
MKQFLVFTEKEFYHIFRDRWTSIVLLLLPVLMIILFGFGITTEIKNTKFAVFDPSKDVSTQEIINKLQVSEYFSFEENLSDPNEIERVFKKGRIGFVIVFGEKFYQNLVQTGEAQILLIADGTDPNTASTLTNYASGIIREYMVGLNKGREIPYAIHTEVNLLYNPTLKGAYSTVPGVMGMILMLICAMMSSISIAREKELGTMEVILVSPMPPLLIILAKVIPYFVISLINFVTVICLAVFVLDVPIVGSLWLLILVSVIFIFVSLALGLLISSVVDTQIAALLFSVMGLMFPVIMLSGLMFPIENMPMILQGIAQIIPAKWYISATRNIMIKGVGISSIAKELIVLSVMAVFFIGLSLKKFKIRLE